MRRHKDKLIENQKDIMLAAASLVEQFIAQSWTKKDLKKELTKLLKAEEKRVINIEKKKKSLLSYKIRSTKAALLGRPIPHRGVKAVTKIKLAIENSKLSIDELTDIAISTNRKKSDLLTKVINAKIKRKINKFSVGDVIGIAGSKFQITAEE